MLYNIHILECNLLYMGENKDSLCKCNNMQVIPSKGKKKKKTLAYGKLFCSSCPLSLCGGKTFGERPKRRYPQNIQFLVQHNVLISLYRVALLCTKHAINVQYIHTCK